MSKNNANKFSPELRERAVRLVYEHRRTTHRCDWQHDTMRALAQWAALRCYVDEGRIEIDNNPAERATCGGALQPARYGSNERHRSHGLPARGVGPHRRSLYQSHPGSVAMESGFTLQRTGSVSGPKVVPLQGTALVLRIELRHITPIIHRTVVVPSRGSVRIFV